MPQSNKIGGAAAITLAATFVVGFAMAVTVLSDYATGDRDPTASVAFLVEHQTALYAWYLIIFVLFGIALVPLVLALHERLRSHASTLMQTATAFGLIWAGLVLAAGMITIVGLGRIDELYAADPGRAESAWAAIDSVQLALGGGVEIVGGLWVLMASAAMRHSDGLPAGLRYLGLAAGAAGVITVVPALEAAGAIFGLGLIVWFAWLGVTLMRGEVRPAVSSRRTLQPAP